MKINKFLLIIVSQILIVLFGQFSSEPDLSYLVYSLVPNFTTPRGTPINAYITGIELNEESYQYYMNQVTLIYDDRTKSTIVSSPSSHYNCHGYAWSVSEGGDEVYIGKNNQNEEDPFMSDTSYIQVCPTAWPAKVSYVSDDHSAITWGSPTWLRSKWQVGCLLEHEWDYGPYEESGGLKYYFKTPIFEGTETICDFYPLSYTIDSVPGATYSWSSSSHFSLNRSGRSIVATPIGEGVAFLQVQISTECGGVVILKKKFNIGSPMITSVVPLIYWDGSTYNNVCKNQTYTTNMQIENAWDITWERVAASPTSTSWSQIGNNVSFYFYQTNQTANFKITGSNSCGITSSIFGFKSIDCSSSGCELEYILSPTPSSDMVSIIPNIPAPCDLNTIMETYSADGNISILSQQGKIFRHQKFTPYSSLEISTLDLKNGAYHLVIFDGKKTHRKTLLVNH